MDYNLIQLKAELMDDNTGFIEDLNVKNWQRLEKELGAKIDELGDLDLEFEQKEAWSQEVEAPDRSAWCQQVDIILLLV